ncbi:MAG: MFS transporter [Nocardioides sp.]|nr:MFS transporter [Nocardioides sp.]
MVAPGSTPSPSRKAPGLTTVTDARSAVEPRTEGNLTLAVLALATGGFAIGTTEFVTMGLIREIADGIGMTIPQAGHVVSAYALGVVVGAPTLAFLGARLPRRMLLLSLMAAYMLFNAASALATDQTTLLVLRFLDGLPHGAYFGVASLVAASLASPERRGRAVAAVMLGLSFANVAGVPAATWLGQHAGWRATYAAVAGLSLLTVLLIWLFVPATPGNPAATGRRELAALKRLPVWLAALAGSVGFGGLFAVYSYVAPTITELGGLGDAAVPVFLLVFGVGMVVGTWVAGRMADWSVQKSLEVGTAGLIVALLAYWALAGAGWWLLPVTFFVTALGSVLVVNLQLRLMEAAGEAETIGAAINHSALNVGNALGAWLGGVVIAAGLGYRAPALVGAALAVLGLVLVLVARVVHTREGHSSASTS